MYHRLNWNSQIFPSLCLQSAEMEGRSCHAQLCRHKQGIFSRVPGNSPDVDMIPCLSELPEPTGHLCWHTGLTQLGAFLLSATVSFLVRQM